MPGKVNYRELATAGKAPSATGPPCTPNVEGMLRLAERARQAKSSGFFRILREGGAKQGKPAPRPRLEKNGNARRASRSTPEEVQREDLARPSSMARASTCWIG